MPFLRRDGVKCRAKNFGGGQGLCGIDAARRVESIGEILGQNGPFFGKLRPFFETSRFGDVRKNGMGEEVAFFKRGADHCEERWAFSQTYLSPRLSITCGGREIHKQACGMIGILASK